MNRRLTFRLPEDLAARLDGFLAEQNGHGPEVTASDVVRHGLELALDEDLDRWQAEDRPEPAC